MSPRKMLSPSILVFSLSLVGGTALASSDENKSACQTWCNSHANCDYCWATFDCDGTRGRNIESFKSGTGWWYACESYASASARNKASCESWCGSRGDCDFCNTTLGCGTGALQKESFGGYGENYYACESHASASARNKAACEGWCNAHKDPAGAIYCDRCSTNNNCGVGSYEHAQWTGYGDNYHACEDYEAASNRNESNCKGWCDATAECHECDTNCFGFQLTAMKSWGDGLPPEGIGKTWYACKETAQSRQNRLDCEAWCSSAGGNEKCDYCSKSVGCGINARHLPGRTWGLGDLFSKNWYACQTHSTASNVNKAHCENWCDANNNDIEADEFCDRCSSSICGPFSRERHLSWIGYGDMHRACEDYDKATARNRQGCENWCSGNKNHYASIYCSQCSSTMCSLDSFEHKKWGNYGGNYSACEKYCIPLLGYTQGGTKERIDLVFVMDKDYAGQTNQFVNDVKKQIDDLLLKVPDTNINANKFNFYRTNLPGDYYEDGDKSNCGKKDSLPDGLRIRCSFADAYAVLHNTGKEYDCKREKIFSAYVGGTRNVFIHEGGHGLFDLLDEYDGQKQFKCRIIQDDCWTSYVMLSNDLNIWRTEEDCREKAQKESWIQDSCYQFTECNDGRWKHGDPLLPDNNDKYCDDSYRFIMFDGSYFSNGFGLAAQRAIEMYLDELPSRSSASSSEAAMLLALNINSEGMQLLETKTVSGAAPNYLLKNKGFTAKVLSGSGGLIGEYSFADPRLIMREGSSGPAMLDEAKFDLIIPLSGKIARAEIVEDSTGKTLVSADLSTYATGENGKPVADPGPQRTVEFSNSGVTLDGSKSYDPDGDPLTYEWSWQAGVASGVNPTALLVPGTENVTLTVSDGELSDSYSVEITVEAAQPPAVGITSPGENTETQGTVRLTADASDLTGVANLSFSVREPDDAEGVPVNQEDLGGFLFEGTRKNGKWELAFDTTKLLDGHYVALAHSADELGNEGWSEAAKFGLRNWQLAARLPSSANNKAGRTMPLKFSVRMKQAVDPAQSFVRNEELEIRVYDTASPENILQTFHYGDSSDAYRIDDAAEEYIANFKTVKGVATEYAVEVSRAGNSWKIGEFLFNTVK